MRRNLDKPDVPLGVRVDAGDYDALLNLLPIKGSRTWLIDTGIRAFLDLMEGSASHRDWARAQIILMRDVRPPNNSRELSVRVGTDLWVRFGRLFPEIGAQTWFVRTFVRAIVDTMSQDAQTLEDRVRETVNDIMRPRDLTESEMQDQTSYFGPDL